MVATVQEEDPSKVRLMFSTLCTVILGLSKRLIWKGDGAAAAHCSRSTPPRHLVREHRDEEAEDDVAENDLDSDQYRADGARW